MIARRVATFWRRGARGAAKEREPPHAGHHNSKRSRRGRTVSMLRQLVWMGMWRKSRAFNTSKTTATTQVAFRRHLCADITMLAALSAFTFQFSCAACARSAGSRNSGFTASNSREEIVPSPFLSAA
jgi:hypothetical protein